MFEVVTADHLCSLCPLDDRGLLSPFIKPFSGVIHEMNSLTNPNADAIIHGSTTHLTVSPDENLKSDNSADLTSKNESADLSQTEELISIGSQNWMRKNLSIKTLTNNAKILHAQSDKDWKMAFDNKIPAWCNPHHDETLGEEIGLLYNFHAINLLKTNLPDGFRIPTVADINQLGSTLIGSPTMFNIFKEENTAHTGCSYRLSLGAFSNPGKEMLYWTSEENIFYTACCFEMDGTAVNIKKMDKNAGLFVRCIQEDNE